MKLKGVSIIEQHIEKLVLLVFVLFAIGVFVTQFDVMGDPNAVKIDNEKVPPDRAVEVVKEKALRLKGQMEDEGERVEPPAQAGPKKVVQAMLDSPILPGMDSHLDLAWSAKGYSAPAPTQGPEIALGNAYLEITPPAPTGVMARAFAGTIDPIEPLSNPELAGFLPSEQPFDKRAVTVQGTFDVAALREMLSTAPADETVNPLPNGWWQGRVELLDVELIRQELHADGTAGAEETVGSLPGRFSLRGQIASSETAPKDLPGMLRDEGDHREEIRRPAYYNMIMGEEWVWPAKAAEMASERPDQKEINRLAQRYRELAKEHDRKAAALKKLQEKEVGGSSPAPAPQRRGEVWPAIPSTWLAQLPPPGHPGGGGDDGAARAAEKRKQAQIKGLLERLEAVAKEMADIEKELAEKYNVGVDGKPLTAQTVEAFAEPLTSLTGPDAQDSVTVWAHDIGVEPGKTYRYKMRVLVTNPLFGHVADVPESQHALASRAAIASADSEWSDAVQTYPERVFFVSGATEAEAGGAMGLTRTASASVDVYEYFYGYWRGGSVGLDQGDTIRVALTLPELPVFNVELDEQGKPIVKGSTMLPPDRTVSEDALLLEVGVSLGAGDRGQVHEAIFGWMDGDLEIRVAEADAEDAMAERAWTSSEQAKTAEVREPGTRGSGTGRNGTPRPNQTGEPAPGEIPAERGRRPGLGGG